MSRPLALADLCQELLILGLQVQASAVQLPDAPSLQQHVLGLMEALRNRALKAGQVAADVEEAQYAVAAFLDEAIQYSRWPDKNAWAQRPLQAVMFGESIAGINFFERLARTRRRSPEALEVYFLCLALGFEGKYRVGGAQELRELLEDLRRELVGRESKVLSPHGARPDTARGGGRGLPLLPLTGAAILLSLAVVVVLYFVMADARTDAVDVLRRLGGR